jgi:hypothetical protein
VSSVDSADSALRRCIARPCVASALHHTARSDPRPCSLGSIRSSSSLEPSVNSFTRYPPPTSPLPDKVTVVICGPANSGKRTLRTGLLYFLADALHMPNLEEYSSAFEFCCQEGEQPPPLVPRGGGHNLLVSHSTPSPQTCRAPRS